MDKIFVRAHHRKVRGKTPKLERIRRELKSKGYKIFKVKRYPGEEFEKNDPWRPISRYVARKEGMDDILIWKSASGKIVISDPFLGEQEVKSIKQLKEYLQRFESWY